MKAPYRVGERFRCFVVVREDKGYGGPYGQTRRWTAWECEDCGCIFISYEARPLCKVCHDDRAAETVDDRK